MERKKKRLLSSVLSGEILKLLFRSVGKSCGDGLSVLVAGIGNRGITPDAIGPMTSDRINVTRHIKKMNPTAFSKMGGYCVSAISCGVMGETGMDTAEILRGVVSNIRPDAIIAVDALAARECENLGAVIQMSDSGIVPGAGVGNRRISVDRQSLGIPVIAIGVPTVVSAATLIKDSLTKEGIFLDSRAEEALESRKNFFVAPKECDLLAECASEIIADAINGSLTVI